MRLKRAVTFGLGLALLAISSLVMAQARTQTFNGHLVDSVCAIGHAHEPGYVENHDKNCNLMPVCIRSGYSVVTAELKVLKLDAKGNDLALALVKATDKDKDWKVAVTGTLEGDTITVSAIKLR